jgi:hypothetical protein
MLVAVEEIGISLALNGNMIGKPRQEVMCRHVRAVETGEEAAIELERPVVGVEDAWPPVATESPQEHQRDIGDGRDRPVDVDEVVVGGDLRGEAQQPAAERRETYLTGAEVRGVGVRKDVDLVSVLP